MKTSKGHMQVVVIILIIVIFLMWLIAFNSRECNSNNECGQGMYCGADNSCHPLPNAQINVVEYHFITPAIIIAIGIVIAAILLRKKKASNDH